MLRSAGIPLGLVTGNLTRIGWKKMDHAGLRQYFSFGAFAEMARTRAGLAKIAMRQARAAGYLGRSTVVTLIGDHPNDVTAARVAGIRSVAVRTGIVRSEELEAAGPDLLLDDLTFLRLEAIIPPVAS